MEEFACEAAIVAASGDDVVEKRVEVRVDFGEFDDAVNHAEVRAEAGQAAQRAAVAVVEASVRMHRT